jgi:tRNA A-37 threonylcarbamoyl transferase component Bud32
MPMNEPERLRQLGPYETVDVLGRGGMATVYKARQEKLDRFVALKVLRPELAGDQEVVARFVREAATAARLEHPNIVPIYDVGAADGVQYIAMRYMAGGTLGDLLARSGPLRFPVALALLEQIAEALDYAHAQGVVHRDLKPGNILLESSSHRASLTDFGIARAGEGSLLTFVGQVAGTPEYMAPEQAQGQPVDARADLYALGILAYEMLSGRVPFEADSGVAVLHQQVFSPPTPLHSLRSDAPSSAHAAVMRMLAKKPGERFPSGVAFIAALQGLTTPGPARGAPGMVHGSRSTVAHKRSPRGVMVPVSVAAATLALVAGALVLAPRAITSQPVASDPGPPTAPSGPAATATSNATPTAPATLAPTVTPLSLPAAPPTAAPASRLTPTPVPTVAPPPPTLAPTPTPVPSPPILTSNDFGPRSLKAGEPFTLTYEIAHPGAAPMRVSLGASIQPSGGGSRIDDPSNDQTVSVQPGRGTYQRVFRIPVDTPPGRYDVMWGLFGPDRQSFGLQTQAGVLVVTASVLNPTTVPTPAPAATLSAVDTVRKYYALLAARNFAAARDMHSAQLQRALDYSRWVSGFDTTRSVTLPSVSLTSQSANSATVALTVASVDVDAAGRTIHRTFQGSWDLVLIGGAWKLDAPSLKLVE